jgi:hypothetical protein
MLREEIGGTAETVLLAEYRNEDTHKYANA